MKYMLLIYLDENGLSETERPHCYEESDELRGPTQLKRTVFGRGPASPDLHGDQRPDSRRQTAGDGRSVRRNSRTARAAIS